MQLATFSVHDDNWSIGSYDDPGPPDDPDADAMSPSNNFDRYSLHIIVTQRQFDSAATEMRSFLLYGRQPAGVRRTEETHSATSSPLKLSTLSSMAVTCLWLLRVSDIRCRCGRLLISDVNATTVSGTNQTQFYVKINYNQPLSLSSPSIWRRTSGHVTIEILL